MEQFVGPVTFAVCGSTVAGGVAGNGLGMGVGAVAGGAVGAAVGVVSAVVGGLKTAAKTVASGVSETATLGAVASRGVLARGDCTMGSAVPYKFGDTTRGILEKGRQARQTPGNGSEKKGVPVRRLHARCLQQHVCGRPRRRAAGEEGPGPGGRGEVGV